MKSHLSKKLVPFIFSITTFLACIFPTSLYGFYELEGTEGYLELRGLLRVFGTAYEYPENSFYFRESSISGLGGIARIIMQGQYRDNLGFEMNAYQTLIPNRLVSNQSALGTVPEVERNSGLEWDLADRRHARLAIDNLNARWSEGRLDLVLGRQPINLSTTFYFSPNDFFAPFAAQTFYRVYKPGVDAMRAEFSLGEFSQLSLIGVLGYKQDPLSETGWADDPDRARGSYLARISTVFNDFEYALLGGNVRRKDVIGGSVQGEVFRWLGIRAEGHISFPDDSTQHSYDLFTIGIEHRWENSLNLRFEQFYNGIGFVSTSDYLFFATRDRDVIPYLGRNYSAFGASYEITPLLTTDMLLIANLTDDSYLWSINATYSLSNEAELSLEVGMPMGKKPETVNIMSEFGLYPDSINVEVRYYF